MLSNTKMGGYQHLWGHTSVHRQDQVEGPIRSKTCQVFTLASRYADAGVARPRVLVEGGQGYGQDYLAPALLHALEGLPVHSVGLPALLSDASARCWRSCPSFICHSCIGASLSC